MTGFSNLNFHTVRYYVGHIANIRKYYFKVFVRLRSSIIKMSPVAKTLHFPVNTPWKIYMATLVPLTLSCHARATPSYIHDI